MPNSAAPRSTNSSRTGSGGSGREATKCVFCRHELSVYCTANGYGQMIEAVHIDGPDAEATHTTHF